MSSFETVSENLCFGGVQGVYAHDSRETGTPMRFSLFAPAQSKDGPVPVLWWLSGLTCTEENFTVKAGAQRLAAEHGFIVVAPDTSPRGDNVPDEDAYDMGTGAGFYVDATEDPWAANYRMYSYITKELPALVIDGFPARETAQGIFGHSMGGHGALTIGLRNPDIYKSVSAFSPIVAPSSVPWGKKALDLYLGDNDAAWANHDATRLVEAGNRCAPILIDQGDDDQFLEEQLKPEIFEAACKKAGQPLELRRQPGYDHSYFFIATFLADHFDWHAKTIAS